MPRWVVAFVLAAVAVLPGRAMAADCASMGDFDVVAHTAFTANTGGTTIQGRVRVDGHARVQGIMIGTNPPLTPDANRADLVVGGNLTVDGGGGSVPNGRVNYGGTLTATGTLTALGGLHQALTPDSPTTGFGALSEFSAQWADLTPNGTVTGPTYNVLTLTGMDPVRNVFAITTAQLRSAGQVTVDVTAGSTTLINVTGSSFTSGLYRVELVGGSPDKVLWNFPLATTVQQTSGLDWQGTLLAPNAAINLGNGNLYGQVVGDGVTVGGEGLFHRPFGGCLPPAPTTDLALASLCTDPVTNRHAMRLRNSGESAHPVSWRDRDSAQAGSFTAHAGTDTFFDLLDGDAVHHIVLTSGSTTLEQTTTTRECAGTITVRKLVTGPGIAPPGPWRILIQGDNGFSATRDLVDGGQAAVAVPGAYQAGSAPIGEIAGGARYTISEHDPLGAVVSLDKALVTITDGQNEIVTLTNDFPTAPEPPEPPTPVPPQPPLPPGPPAAPPGPTSSSRRPSSGERTSRSERRCRPASALSATSYP